MASGVGGGMRTYRALGAAGARDGLRAEADFDDADFDGFATLLATALFFAGLTFFPEEAASFFTGLVCFPGFFFVLTIRKRQKAILAYRSALNSRMSFSTVALSPACSARRISASIAFRRRSWSDAVRESR